MGINVHFRVSILCRSGRIAMESLVSKSKILVLAHLKGWGKFFGIFMEGLIFWLGFRLKTRLRLPKLSYLVDCFPTFFHDKFKGILLMLGGIQLFRAF